MLYICSADLSRTYLLNSQFPHQLPLPVYPNFERFPTHPSMCRCVNFKIIPMVMAVVNRNKLTYRFKARSRFDNDSHDDSCKLSETHLTTDDQWLWQWWTETNSPRDLKQGQDLTVTVAMTTVTVTDSPIHSWVKDGSVAVAMAPISSVSLNPAGSTNSPPYL